MNSPNLHTNSYMQIRWLEPSWGWFGDCKQAKRIATTVIRDRWWVDSFKWNSAWFSLGRGLRWKLFCLNLHKPCKWAELCGSCDSIHIQINSLGWVGGQSVLTSIRPHRSSIALLHRPKCCTSTKTFYFFYTFFGIFLCICSNSRNKLKSLIKTQ